jgi:hypothetical protein
LPSLPADAYLTLSPHWICEVLSPATEMLDRGKKLRSASTRATQECERRRSVACDLHISERSGLREFEK